MIVGFDFDYAEISTTEHALTKHFSVGKTELLIPCFQRLLLEGFNSNMFFLSCVVIYNGLGYIIWHCQWTPNAR